MAQRGPPSTRPRLLHHPGSRSRAWTCVTVAVLAGWPSSHLAARSAADLTSLGWTAAAVPWLSCGSVTASVSTELCRRIRLMSLAHGRPSLRGERYFAGGILEQSTTWFGTRKGLFA